MRDLEMMFYFPHERMPKPNGVFGHHKPCKADRAEHGRPSNAAQCGEFTVDRPRCWMGRLIKGLQEFER
jgi:hypothetical protein